MQVRDNNFNCVDVHECEDIMSSIEDFTLS